VGVSRAVHAAITDCPTDEVCVWSGTNYTGPVTVIQDETCDTAAVRSAANNGPDTLKELRVYARPGCVGPVTVLRHGMQAQSLDGHRYTHTTIPRIRSTDARERGLAEGSDAYLTKPIDVGTVADVMAGFLEGGRWLPPAT
jgi:Peptidase inhibitor family I36